MANFIDDPKLRKEWRENMAKQQTDAQAAATANVADALGGKPIAGGQQLDPWFSPPKTPEEAQQRQQAIENFWKQHPDGTVTFPTGTNMPRGGLPEGTRLAPDGVNRISTVKLPDGSTHEVSTLIGVVKPGTNLSGVLGSLGEAIGKNPGNYTTKPIEWSGPNPWDHADTVGRLVADSIGKGQGYKFPQVVSALGSADQNYGNWQKWQEKFGRKG